MMLKTKASVAAEHFVEAVERGEYTIEAEGYPVPYTSVTVIIREA